MSKVAVVIVNYRAAALTLDAVASVARQRGDLPDLRCVVVDGGSGDGSADIIARGLDDPAFHGWASLLALEINGGFGWANNQAMLRLMQGDDPPDYIHLLNPDAIVQPGAIRALADVLDAHPRCGAVGSLLLDPDGQPSGSAFRFPTLPREFVRGSKMAATARLFRIEPILIPIGRSGPADWVTGASVMLRAAALKESGLFDDGFFLYFEEVELMWRLTRAGWSVRHEATSRVAHVGGAATGVNMSGRLAKRPPLPSYWYASRRRLYTRLWGPAGSAGANAAWLAGRTLSMVRLLTPYRIRPIEVEHETRDLIRHGMVPKARDFRAAVVRWTDPPGVPPAWMREA